MIILLGYTINVHINAFMCIFHSKHCESSHHIHLMCVGLNFSSIAQNYSAFVVAVAAAGGGCVLCQAYGVCFLA